MESLRHPVRLETHRMGACAVSDETLLDAAAILRRAARLLEWADDKEGKERMELLEEGAGKMMKATELVDGVIGEERRAEQAR